MDIVTYKDETITTYLETDNLRDSTPTSSLPHSEVRRYLLNNLDAAQATYTDHQSYLPSINSITSSMSALWNYTRGSDVNDNEENTNGWYIWMPVAISTVLGQDLELPALHPSYKMNDYTYLYGLGVADEGNSDNGQQRRKRPNYWNSIVKLDVHSKTQQAQWQQRECYPSEAIFIPRQPSLQQHDTGSTEDDGVLVSVVLDVVRRVSFLLVLDASSFDEIARADLGLAISLSFGRGSFKRRQ
ncbi:unnamed protein product [Absidia cylindrospora]